MKLFPALRLLAFGPSKTSFTTICGLLQSFFDGQLILYFAFTTTNRVIAVHANDVVDFCITNKSLVLLRKMFCFALFAKYIST
jgi:hypothetical protein